MRLLFFGSGDLAVPTLRHLADHHDVLQVVTQPERPSGRGRKLTPTPVCRFASERALPTLTVPDVNAAHIVSALLGHDPQLGVVIAFGQKIGPALLQGIPGGCINAHASLLPQYRGAAPIHWAILNGEARTGMTVFKLSERMDAGPILTRRVTQIKPDEPTAELHDRLAGITVDAVRAALELYAGDPDPPGEAQDENLATRAPKLKKEDGLIDFSRPAAEVARHIRAMWSWPGARCEFASSTREQREQVILARARVAEAGPVDLAPGTVDARRLVAAGDGMLELLEIKPAGSRLIGWQEFVNGRHVQAGDRFLGRVADPASR